MSQLFLMRSCITLDLYYFLKIAILNFNMLSVKRYVSYSTVDDTLTLQTTDNIDVIAERIMNNYGNKILRVAYSYLHNMSDAEDILQDTLIQYIKTMPTLSTCEHEKAWCIRVAVNLSKNKIKYNNVRKADELSETLVSSEDEDLSVVWDAVKNLPEKFRETIHLFYYEGYSTSDIAKILNKKESTVRSNLHRGRAELKKVLVEVYDFE